MAFTYPGIYRKQFFGNSLFLCQPYDQQARFYLANPEAATVEFFIQ